MTFLYFAFSGLINMITSLLLGFFVLSRNIKSPTNRSFAYFAFSVGFWSLAYVGWQISTEANAALLWCRVLMAGAIFIPSTFLHFCINLVDKRKEQMTAIITGYFASTIFLILDVTSLFIKEVSPRAIFSYWPSAGITFAPFLVMFIGLAFYAHLLLFNEYRAASGFKRNQILFVFLGTAIGFIGGSTNYPLWYGINILPIGNILVSVYVAFVAYAIVRHQLMDIEVIIKKTLVFAGLLASTFAILIVPTLLIQEYILRSAGTSGRMIGLTISGMIIILSMRRIETFLINITDRYLFQKKYNYKELLKTFTSEVLTVLNLGDLLNLTVNKLTELIKLNSCAVMLFDNEKQQFDVRASMNITDSSVSLVKLDGMVTFLEHTHGHILKKELSDKKIFIPEDVQAVMGKLSSELVIPMVLHEKVIGILSLGKKKSDEDYTQDDLDILLPLAKTLAIAISNAELFDELGKTQAEAAQKEKMAVIGTLSAGINHEICNPLGIVRGQCEVFLLNARDGIYKDKSAEELLQMAKGIMVKVIKETDRATVITKKLSNFAKPSKGDAEPVDIYAEIGEVFGLVSYELKLGNIEIEKIVDDNLPRILVDRKQFQEVLFNLIRNAAQALGENRGKITVAARAREGKVIIDIQDTGSGIPEEKIKELFNPFFTTKAPGKGTGLGLFIVRQIVEKNGGRIYLKSTKVGEGTTFTVEFPEAVPQEAKV